MCCPSNSPVHIGIVIRHVVDGGAEEIAMADSLNIHSDRVECNTC